MKVCWVVLILFLIGFVSTEEYYVSNSGNDSWDGKSDATAWKTIGKVNSFSFAVGDDVYFKCGGVWSDRGLYIDWNGTKNDLVVIGSYYGNGIIGVNGDGVPKIDGEYRIPTGVPDNNELCEEYWENPIANEGPVPSQACFVSTNLVKVFASNIKLENFHIDRSRGRGLTFGDSNVSKGIISNIIVDNVEVSNSREEGMYFLRVYNGEIKNSIIRNNVDYAIYSRGAKDGIYWAGGLYLLANKNITIKNNKIYENFGEGYGDSLFGNKPGNNGSYDIYFYNNEVYDNYALNIYIGRGNNKHYDGNLIYYSGNEDYYKGGKPRLGIAIVSETGGLVNGSFITNNIFSGCSNSIANWQQTATGGEEYRHIYIYGNTFLKHWPNGSSISFGAPVVSDVYIYNNIILEPKISLSGGRSNYIFKNNLWGQNPGVNYCNSSNGDICGRDIRLKASNFVFNPNNVNVTQFVPLADSPAIDNGRNLGNKFNADFFGNARIGFPDIGAIESGVVIAPVSEDCNNSVDDDSDGFVDCLDSDCPACVVDSVVSLDDIFAKISDWKAGRVSFGDMFEVILEWGRS